MKVHSPESLLSGRGAERGSDGWAWEGGRQGRRSASTERYTVTALPLVHSAGSEVTQESCGLESPRDQWTGRVSLPGAVSVLGAVGRCLGDPSFPGVSGLVLCRWWSLGGEGNGVTWWRFHDGGCDFWRV